MFYSDTKTFELEHVHIRLVPLNYLALIIDTNLSLNFIQRHYNIQEKVNHLINLNKELIMTTECESYLLKGIYF